MVVSYRFILTASFASLCLTLARAGAADDKVDFNRDVRPILSSKCTRCHGPDDQARKAGLRLDLRDGATKKLKDDAIAIVAGKPQESELIRRVMESDDDEVMPPPKAGSRLSAAQIATLRKWIEQGAEYSQHWAYVKPVRPSPPKVSESNWPINEVDRFVLAKLEKEHLRPAPAADRYALIRRVSLDLTGLPPTIQEADEFMRDNRADAYERIVDRLLAKPAYGERWAQVWLDLARYADSQGFANDPDRSIWRWRDWVIASLNSNKPFDQFTLEQIAGDMLPNPTPEQIIATGFHRNTLTNTEGGINPEEFRCSAVVDRVNTTMQVWMAATLGCAQCHNHKYDPYSQKEYYQLYAIFNNSLDANAGDDAPTVEAPRMGMENEFTIARREHEAYKAGLDAVGKNIDADEPAWEKAAEVDKLPEKLRDIFKKPAKDRSKDDQAKLNDHFRLQSKPFRELTELVKNADERYKAASTTTPVLRETTLRETFILLRGNFEAKGDKVQPGLPQVFPQPSQSESINRLTLARWLVNPENPLTARVAVNRLWEQLFGIGIVETAEDFGTQGEAPSHPELLDWLASEYVRVGWDTKKLLKLIVTSATYRQSSAVSEALAMRDPMNRLLARGPRVRLSAESVRDQALFVAGLLSAQLYGPPCQPPKPNLGLAAAFGSTTDWKADIDDNRFRRGLYVRVRRNAPYPSMTTFDAPERTSCTVRRIRTNTPLQALVTLNDPCFVEAAQALARRIIKEGGDSAASRIAFAFRACLTRPPSDAERTRLAELFDQTRAVYAKDEAKAKSLTTSLLGPAPKEMNPADLAAWTVVSNVLLNLDETLAKR